MINKHKLIDYLLNQLRLSSKREMSVYKELLDDIENGSFDYNYNDLHYAVDNFDSFIG